MRQPYLPRFMAGGETNLGAATQGRRTNIARAGLTGRGASLRRFPMQKHALVLTTFAFILAVGAMAASAQQIPDVATTPQQPRILQQQQEQERQLQGVQTPVISRTRAGWAGVTAPVGGTTRLGSRRHGPGMIGRGAMMGPGSMGHRHDDADALRYDGQ